jgi:hypothetical protein
MFLDGGIRFKQEIPSIRPIGKEITVVHLMKSMSDINEIAVPSPSLERHIGMPWRGVGQLVRKRKERLSQPLRVRDSTKSRRVKCSLLKFRRAIPSSNMAVAQGALAKYL